MSLPTSALARCQGARSCFSDTSQDNVCSATRILASALCCHATVTGLRARGVLFSRKTEGVVHEFTVSTGIDRVTVHEMSCLPAPGMTLWRNFFPESVLPEASSQELPLGYAGNVSVVLGSFQGSLDEGFDLRDKHSHVLGQSCSRFVEFHHSASRVMLKSQHQFRQKPPCREQDGTEVCSSTSLQSHSSTFPTRCQNGFCVRRRHGHQFREALTHLLHDGNSCRTADKSNIMNIALAIPLSQRHFSTRLVEFHHIQLLKLCFRQQEKSIPSKRESISMVACVEEDRVQTRPGQTRPRSRSRRNRK